MGMTPSLLLGFCLGVIAAFAILIGVAWAVSWGVVEALRRAL